MNIKKNIITLSLIGGVCLYSIYNINNYNNNNNNKKIFIDILQYI